ncbi:MAG: acyltransferase family protein [Gemmatimonadaceae bacterium]
MPSETPSFRADIEGLRGVAILLVVLFHAGVPALPGGFVGVDVFFVLSGFFITGLLVREREMSGEVDLSAFYARRALRLLPALLLVLLATLLAVMTLYAPIDRVDIASSARAVALHSGNIEFARGAVDYFSAGESPLLHTWSLAVEEQFYLVWPLFFLFVALVHDGRGVDEASSKARLKKSLVVWLVLLALLSFAASLWLTRTAQPWAFFGMPTRIWEFALGGLLAVALDERRFADSAPSLGNVGLQLGGLVAIAIASITYDRATPYPGTAALVPALAACGLLIGGARTPRSVVSKTLSLAPLRWLGRVSYAWYLWHWPLVGVAVVLHPRVGLAGKLAWSAVALVLAWLTYRFVERPVRAGRLSRVPIRWVAPLSVLASVVAALIAHAATRAAERQVALPQQRALVAARGDRMRHDCWASTVEDAKESCELGDVSAATTIALLGDSHAEHWLGGLDRVGIEHGWKIVAMVKGGCPVADVPADAGARRGRWYRECARYREAMLRRIIAMRPNAVVLSSWDHYLPVDGGRSRWQVSPEEWRLGLRKTYARLTAAGIRTIVIRDVPRTWFDVPACLSRRAAALPFARACTYDRDESLSRSALREQNAALRGLPVRVIDMNDRICASQRCDVIRNGAVVFTDDNHLTATFSRSLARVLGERIALAIHVATQAPAK